MLSNFAYTKSRPKVNDYNPLTHTNTSSGAADNPSKWVSQAHLSQSAPQGFFAQSQDRFYKSKPRCEVANPLFGTTYQVQVNKSKDNTAGYAQRPQHQPDKYERISGAMRMPVSNVAYINPYTIEKSNNN